MGMVQPILNSGKVGELSRLERGLDVDILKRDILPDLSLTDRTCSLLGQYESSKSAENFIDMRAKVYTAGFEGRAKSKLNSIEASLRFLKSSDSVDKKDIALALQYELSDTGFSVEQVMQKFGTKEWKTFKRDFVKNVKSLHNIDAIALDSAFHDYKFAREVSSNPESLWKYPQYQLEGLIEELHDTRPDDFGRIQIDEKSFVDPNHAMIVSDTPEETAKILQEKGYDRLSNFVRHTNEYTLDGSTVFNFGEKSYTLSDIRGLVSGLRSGKVLSETENTIAVASAPHVDSLDPYSAGELEKNVNDLLTVSGKQTRISKRGKLASIATVAAIAGIGALYALSGALHGVTTGNNTGSNSTSGSHTTSSGNQGPLPNATLYQDIVRNIQDDQRITGDKTALTNLAVQLFTDLHYGTGKVNVLQSDGSYKQEFLTEPTVQAFTNYTSALQKLSLSPIGPNMSLPQHPINTLYLLGNASQINPDIVNFNPISWQVPYPNGITQIDKIQSQNIPLDVWSLAQHIQYTPYVVKHPEMFEALNTKVQQEDLVLFESARQSPTNASIWNDIIIPNWNYHWLATPQEGNTSQRITIYPWYNSTLMSQWFPDRNDRQLIERQMWMPSTFGQYDAKTGNLTNQIQIKTIEDNLEMIVNGSQFGSFNGTLYTRIMAAWNNKSLNSYNYAHTDNFIAWDSWNARNGKQLGVVLTDLQPQANTFEANYKPLINETNPINKLAFAYGLNVLDQAVKGIPEQYDCMGAMIYAKALGGAVFQDGIIRTASGVQDYTHQTVAIPIPEFLDSKLPSDTIYGPGHAISLASSDSANIQSGTPYITRWLPDDSTVKMKVYKSS